MGKLSKATFVKRFSSFEFLCRVALHKLLQYLVLIYFQTLGAQIHTNKTYPANQPTDSHLLV